MAVVRGKSVPGKWSGGGGCGGVAEFRSVDYLYIGIPEIERINQL